MIDGTLLRVVPPEPLVIIAQGWPSFLISALAMGLPIAGAFFPASLHRYFNKTKSGELTWYDLDDFKPSEYKDNGILVASGSMDFLRHIHRRCNPTLGILCVERKCRGEQFRRLQRDNLLALKDLTALGYSSVTAQHACFGGCTRASHVVGLSPALLGNVTLNLAPMEIPRSISHYLNAATKGHYGVWIDRPPDEPYLHPIRSFWLDEARLVYTAKRGDVVAPRPVKRGTRVLRPEGLLPITSPGALVACPSVFGPPNTSCLRSISLPEALRIFSIPSFMDEVLLESLEPIQVKSHLPFEDVVSPDIAASIFRQLWEISDVGGCGGWFGISRD